MKLVIKRLRAATPPFFKKLRVMMISFGTIGTMLMAAKAQYHMAWPPDRIIEFLITMGVVGACVSSLAMDDNTKQSLVDQPNSNTMENIANKDISQN